MGLLAAGCAGVEIGYDYDASADFGRLRSYAWLPGPQPETGDPRLDNTIIDSRIRSAVDTTLAARGYQKDLPSCADFLVAYHAGIDRELEIDTIDRYYGPGPGPRLRGPVMVTETVVRDYDQGTLLLDVLEGRSRALLWRGSAQARLTRRASPAERKARVDDAVARLLAKFPPPEGASR